MLLIVTIFSKISLEHTLLGVLLDPYFVLLLNTVKLGAFFSVTIVKG